MVIKNMGKHIFLEDVHIIQRIRIHDDSNKKYYRVQPCIDSIIGKENNDYYWVQKRDENNKLVENIYDVENDKFVLDEWVNSAGGGLINGNEVNLRKVKHTNSMTHPIDCFYNKVNVKDGKLSYNEWLTGDEWIHGLQKRDIIV